MVLALRITLALLASVAAINKPSIALNRVGGPHRGNNDTISLNLPLARTGGNLIALAKGFIFAHLNSYKRINFKDTQYSGEVLDLPPNPISVGTGVLNGHVAGGLTHSCSRCDTSRCSLAGWSYCQYCVKDLRWAFLKHIKPLFRSTSGSDYEEPGENELVIHMRSGDALEKVTTGFFVKEGKHALEGALYPCAVYDFAIRRGNQGKPFDSIRIVTEEDLLNPCIHEVSRRHSNVRVQSKSVLVDMATLRAARHLVLASSFASWSMALMNVKLKNLFLVQQSEDKADFHVDTICGIQTWISSMSDPGLSVPTIIRLSVREIELWDKRNETEWMVGFPEGEIKEVEACPAFW